MHLKRKLNAGAEAGALKGDNVRHIAMALHVKSRSVRKLADKLVGNIKPPQKLRIGLAVAIGNGRPQKMGQGRKIDSRQTEWLFLYVIGQPSYNLLPP